MAWCCGRLPLVLANNAAFSPKKGLSEELSGAPDSLVDLRTGHKAHDHAHAKEEACADPACTDPTHDHSHKAHDHSHGHTHDAIGIDSFVYAARRPFAPARLLPGTAGGLIHAGSLSAPAARRPAAQPMLLRAGGAASPLGCSAAVGLRRRCTCAVARCAGVTAVCLRVGSAADLRKAGASRGLVSFFLRSEASAGGLRRRSTHLEDK